MATKQRIMIVDDDENINELISLYLTKECFETKMVYDGESALRELSVFKPNLIILDLMLPGIDGYQVCREIRKTNNVPIIMLSAKGETFDKVLGLELGADDYMIKPFETKELVARVKAVLRRYHLPQSATSNDISTQQCVQYPDLTINLATILCFTMEKLLKCRQRNLSFCISLLLHLIKSLQENNFLTISGDMNTWVTLVPLMYTLNVFVKKLKTTNTGELKQSGVSVTSS